ncbi:hypothetical protein GCM10025857_20800 [Alicyclobacillus contaminans]|uniref:hypothetical protein n=1 Tax=Alicyclobacillus contaminans TaxID=392016 RepID=UPI0004217D18|nr:hypothetical protein [Alicyclobacillus contaminans]GMA50723.1 hypothetical protein GCM10025857_20800 [Alicyclobacillus contaminans]
MRISHVCVDLTADDLNSLIADFAAEANLRFTEIIDEGIRGQVKLLFFNVDFFAKPASTSPEEVSVDVTAHKLMAIPGSVVNRQLREAMKDAPAGIDVIRNSLVVHLPSLLRTVGVDLRIRELRCYNGYLRAHVEKISLPAFHMLGQTLAAGWNSRE